MLPPHEWDGKIWPEVIVFVVTAAVTFAAILLSR